MMYAPRVFASMLGALIVFAVSIYLLTGSVGTTLWQTVLAAVLLQIGYFIGVLVLVARAARQKRQKMPADDTTSSDRNAARSGAVPVSRMNTRERPNL